MSARPAPPPPRRQADVGGVPVLEWPAFLRRFRWEQGQHVVMLGPTGRGKSTLACEILKRRDYVVVLDVKGDDPTLTAAGYQRVSKWPNADLEKDAAEKDADLRLRLSPPPLGSLRDRVNQAREVFLGCLEDVSTRGGWTVYIDELRITGEPRLYDLAPEIDALVLGGRSRGVTIVSSTQAPRWVPKAAYDQVQHVFLWPVRDQDGLRRMEEVAGLGKEIRPVLEGMGKHQVLYRRPPDVTLITQCPPPGVAPAAAAVDDAAADISATANGPDRRPNQTGRRGPAWLRQRTWGEGKP